MNSSGIKRGLATTAITALAVTGIPFLATSASAETLNNSVATADSVVVVAPDTATASTKNDGQNTTIRLEAIAGANVAQVRFEYKIGAATTYTPIATVARNDNGAFSTEWAAAGLNGATVSLRAVGVSAAGVDGTATGDDTVTISNAADSVNITDGAVASVFQKPDYDGAGGTDGPLGTDDAAKQNVSVSGTSSSTTAAPGLTYWDPGAKAYQGAGTTSSTTATTTPAQTTGTWSGVIDITGYEYGTTDELLIKATLPGVGGTDDAEAFALTRQVITTVTAVPDRTNVPAGQTATVTVTVKDQAGNPIVGAEVRDSDGVLVGQTDSAGQVKPTQGPGSKFYYANATASNPYEDALGDKKSDAVTVTQYAATETTLASNSVDGAAFDFTEHNPAADISVQIKDQNGNNITASGRTVNYYWVNTPFDGSPATIRTPLTGTSDAVTVNGKASIPLPTAVQGREAGTFELFAGLAADGLGNGAIAPSKVLTVKAGEAVIKFDEAEPEQAVAGGSETVAGKLVLEDGTGLGGRNIVVSYDNGATGDANIVQQDNSTGPTRTVATGANGEFSVVVRDVAVAAPAPQPTESGTVTAESTTGTVDNDDPTTDAVEQDVQFVKSETPGKLDVAAETAIVIDGGSKTPGRPVYSSVTVRSNDDDPATPGDESILLANQEVTLTVDEGFFAAFTDTVPLGTITEAELTRDPAPAIGADAGEYKSLGKSITVKTNANGVATFVVAIEDNAGFNDDGAVNANVKATLGALTDTEVVDWKSADPLNGGEVQLVLSPADQQDGPTDPAVAGQDVAFDVYVTDQFGNRVGNETVTITENGDDAEASDTSVVSNFDDNGDFTVTSTDGDTVTVTASWVAETFKYTTATGTGTPLPGTDETLTDSADITFYEAVVTTTTIESSPEGEVPVGTAVTETVTVLDQEGNPIQGVAVEFIRNGPGAGDGDANVNRTTNAQGKAFYTFIGTQAGTAAITATVTTDAGIETLNDSVRFVGTTPPPPPPTGGRLEINAVLTGLDNGAANDRLKVTTKRKAAAGATVRLFKKVNGRKILVKVKKLNEFGAARFIAIDRNGRDRTDYFAVVLRTAKTQADRTNNKTIR